LALIFAAALMLGGCASTSIGRGEGPTRRGVEREYLSSPSFGGPRGRQFEDIIPVGARITAVHVAHGSGINAIWLSYERNGEVRHTPRRGGAGTKTEVLRLGRREKIIGIHAYGQGTIDDLFIATNERVVSFGDGDAPGLRQASPWYTRLTEQDRKQYVAIGIVGRADDELRRLSLRIQVRKGQ
jgi:hypothetical protein